MSNVHGYMLWWYGGLCSGRGGSGLEEYSEKFEANGHDDLSIIAMLSENGVNKLIADVKMTNRG